MEIIPAIDLINGRCVRLSQGDYKRKTVYSDDPVTTAGRFAQAGMRRLHVVDLDGAREGRPRHTDVLKNIVEATGLHVDFGGGIRGREQAARALEAGAAQITAGSIAVKNPDEVKTWAADFGMEKIILGADVRGKNVAVSGWREQTEVKLWSFLEYYEEIGLRYLICTDIERDGMLNGPAVELYKEIIRRFPRWQLIASGGVGTTDDIRALEEIGCAGVIIGKALYEERITLRELEAFLC